MRLLGSFLNERSDTNSVGLKPDCPSGRLWSPRTTAEAKRFNYNFDTRNGRIGLFLNVNNLFGVDPEEFLNAAFNSNFSEGVRGL